MPIIRSAFNIHLLIFGVAFLLPLVYMSELLLFARVSSSPSAFLQESGTAHSPVHNVYKRTDLYLCADHVVHTACIVTFGFFSVSNCPTLSRQIGPW